MPRIRDLGISVIPATMRPPEIGDGGAYGACDPTNTDVTCHPTDPQCNPTKLGECHPTDPYDRDCHPTDPYDGDCHPTDGTCNPTEPPPPQCDATYDDQCCPTDQPHSAKDRDGDSIDPEMKRELMQQLRNQIDAQP